MVTKIYETARNSSSSTTRSGLCIRFKIKLVRSFRNLSKSDRNRLILPRSGVRVSPPPPFPQSLPWIRVALLKPRLLRTLVQNHSKHIASARNNRGAGRCDQDANSVRSWPEPDAVRAGGDALVAQELLNAPQAHARDRQPAGYVPQRVRRQALSRCASLLT